MYKVVGADRREYGPVTRETILEWIAQGRSNAQTIARFEDGAWKPLAAFDEFKEALAVAGPPPIGSVAQPTTLVSSAEPPPFSGVGSRSETNIASVIGIVAPIVCCWCCYVGPIIGLISSLIGLSQIHGSPNRYATSDVLPKIGLVISILMLVLHIIGPMLNVALGRMLQIPFGQ